MTAGFPDPQTFLELSALILENGGDLLEVGIPFSDPLADGPTIQASSQIALQHGMSVSKTFSLIAKLRKTTLKPVIIMTYINPVLAYGLEEFVKSCKEVGVNGVIIPDLPPEEAALWKESASSKMIDTIFLIAPTTPKERVPLINGYTSGFIYYVSTTGVTGSTGELPQELFENLMEIRGLSRWPVAVGFGISTSEQVASLAPYTDGIVIGSAIIRQIQKSRKDELFDQLEWMIKEFKQATCRSKKWRSDDISSESFL